ncbi:hypothetical protein BD769DRAFT_1664942 [Suillus cothurnatus]|nr:hypothetical protein BD769DRAFT_1675359 [Suillus cothurnatus]KAG2134995.1 hypothetical protein BD769DRAFT_1664942 [Suillus cothurnatus]
MNSNEYHPHVVRFANPVFTIVDFKFSNPTWSSERSIGKEFLIRAIFFIIDYSACLDSMEHRDWTVDFSPQDESEPLDFGLDSPPSCQESEHSSSDVEGSEPLDFGLDSIPVVHHNGGDFTVNDDETEYDFGLPLKDERVDEMYDQELLDFGIPRSPPVIFNDAPAVTPTHTSGKHVKSRFSAGHHDHTSGSTDQKYENPRRMHVLPMSSPHRPFADNPPDALPLGLEDPDKPLSDRELLKMCHSMRLGVLSEDEFKYARRLLTEAADRDNEHGIASPTLQDIIEAERPLHLAYTQATATLRKRVQDLQGAIRLHNHTQQLRDQVQAMLDCVERRQYLFK